MADGIKARIGGVWKDLTPNIKVGGVWKEPDAVHIRVGGVWKEVWSAVTPPVTPTVSPRADGDSNLVLDPSTPVECWQRCYFDTDGQEYESVPSTGNRTNATTWKDSGDSAGAWVEFVRTAGATAWDNRSASVRYNLGTNQVFSMYVTTSLGSVSRTISGYFRMWDAASGGNILWTGPTATWSCTATVQTGPCSIC